MEKNGHACPGCGRDDLVQAVPAAYLAGRDDVTRRERNRDGDVRTVTRRVTTALSEALAPVPREPTYGLGVLGVFTGFVSVAAFVGWVLLGKAFEEVPDGVYFGEPPSGPDPDFSFLGRISGLALCVTLLVVVVLVRRRGEFVRLTRGRERAEELWACGWYCHRCGTVHLRDLPEEDVRPFSLQEFRERVWERGGYGELAARQRAIG
ncbi:hypothetical protein [Streptomyces sp. NPDC053431]|uniref:hypothetical protein n=1 Tax=Streptomyces sp. NPDC053431 TaxID=3365703 RepID=UPI0037D7AF4C